MFASKSTHGVNDSVKNKPDTHTEKPRNGNY